MKERVTLTIDNDVLQRVDELIDGTEIKNRSHAVELLLTKSLSYRKPRKALILAGGKSSRIKNKDMPSCLMTIHNRPILEHLLDLFKKFDIKDILIAIGSNGKPIKEYFGSGLQFGVRITYLEESHPLGTAGPLNMAKPYLTEPFIMCNGDELKNINLNDLYAFHNNNAGIATIALTTTDDPSSYGVALLDGNKIITFVEKPNKENSLSNLINAGLYIMNPEVLNFVPDGFAQLEQDVFPKLAHQHKLFGYVFSGQWFDTKTPEKLKKAEKDWKEL
ncbi:hypothetical protein C4573_01875 [Candidatus Woesearchaeota archaeon]|nr:MAG: hypothetical protein C4573_01875 [Candidatus Woesearchaeota archaeon]